MKTTDKIEVKRSNGFFKKKQKVITYLYPIYF